MGKGEERDRKTNLEIGGYELSVLYCTYCAVCRRQGKVPRSSSCVCVCICIHTIPLYSSYEPMEDDDAQV